MPRRKLNPCSYFPRRLQIVISLTTLVAFCIVFLGNSNSDDFDPLLDKVPFGPQLQSSVHHAVQGAQNVVDRLPNPLAPPAHRPPPEQANSSSEEARWYSDWSWQNPFSSSITFDEDRAVLPPQRDRPPVYTYFDASGRRKDEKSKKAEQDLVQIWRRAWWAKGFRPVVLSNAEAMNHPLYKTLQDMSLQPEVEMELLRWLAWANMGSGILSNWLAVPMAPYDDPLLTFFRQRVYPDLTRFEKLGTALFVGSKDQIEHALKEALNSPALKDASSILDAIPSELFKVDPHHDGIAYYSVNIISDKYPTIKTQLDNPDTRGDGLAILPELINSHLHQTWQNLFARGIAVLKPLPAHTTTLILPAIDIARNLSQCSLSPLPSSCPPNRPRCKPCVSNKMPILVPRYFTNESDLFTIATMPHPYTTNSLMKTKHHLDLKFVRRETSRDTWLLDATDQILMHGTSARSRLPVFKDAVASEYGNSHSLWLTAERPLLNTNPDDVDELDWTFGFQLPRDPIPNGKSETPVPGPERRPPVPKQEYGDGPVPSEHDLRTEVDLLERAKIALNEGRRGSNALGLSSDNAKNPAVQLRNIVEAWNLADTEAWKFVRAFNARRRLERHKWMEEEETYSGGKGFFVRLVDKVSRR